ncbi:transcription factor bHLH149-like [Amaranthus tricolor]|uniref:transcription factor bHLH149-like n=1 Tax=Amaranthus tricolor TaxID=29722 RepID=UPI00258EE47B|nr:transcription factor bHLH149-like [Amaranthus tricolor]
MDSTISTYEEHTEEDTSRELSMRKKRRRIDPTVNQNQSNNTQNQIRWRSQGEQKSYSSKLLNALRQVRRRNPTSAPVSESRAVRDAADKALAIAAKGRTRWSRAILANRLKLRLKKHKKAKVRSRSPPQPPVTGTSRLFGENNEQQKLTALDKRVKVLGRLVPGCRKLSLSNLLEEATDYIAALQMQVGTMAALTELLTGSSSGSSSGSMETNSTGS